MSNTKRLPFEGLYIYVFLLLIAFILADLGILKFQAYLESQKITPSGSSSGLLTQGSNEMRPSIASDQYNRIADRNLFNADGIIPPPIGAEKGGMEFDDSMGPVKTDLPIQLLGTIVHSNPYKSIASLLLQGEESPEASRVGDMLKDLAEILGVFRRKVVFRNLKSQRLEFVEIPEDAILKVQAPATPKQPSFSQGGPRIDRKGNTFTVNRADVKNQLDDYMSLARTASAVPEIDPATGETKGFKITRMLPGSLFANLGIQPGDVVTGVNGEKITSVNKALEIFGMLKNQVDSVDKVSISIERGGKPQDLSYSVSD